MRSATRNLAGAGTTRAANGTTKAAAGAGASTGKAGENLKAEARNRIDPLALVHSLLATVRATRGNASTNTKLITSAQSALAG